MLSLNHYLILSAVLFSIGTAGVFLRRNLRAGVLLSLMLAIEVAWGLSRIGLTTFSTDPGAVSSISSVARIGTALFTTHSFAFEVTSVLILVSMVGAVVIARRER